LIVSDAEAGGVSFRQRATPEKRTSFLRTTTGEGRNALLLGNWRAPHTAARRWSADGVCVVARPNVCPFADTREPVV
jgi:hypothetical protein